MAARAHLVRARASSICESIRSLSPFHPLTSIQPSSANYPGVFNIDNHHWSATETGYLIAGTLLGQSMEQISNFFASATNLFNWPASYCHQRIAYLIATEVLLPRDWLVPNTLSNPPYLPQLSEDEEAELRIFVQTGTIHTDHVFRDYRTHQWLHLACLELHHQRVHEPELWLAKFNTAWEATTHRRISMPARWLQWRQRSAERRERLEAGQWQRWVSDDEIAGEMAGGEHT